MKIVVIKLVEYVFNKMVIIQKWLLNVMFLLYSDELFLLKLICVQVFLVIKDSDEVKFENLIFVIKDSVYNGKLIFL